MDRGDYQAPLIEAQLASLRAVFPGGVCDYSRPSVAQQAPQTWPSYPRPGGAGQTAGSRR